MIVEQRKWKEEEGWTIGNEQNIRDKKNLILVFGNRQVLTDEKRFQEIRNFYPDSQIVIGSTAGEIIDTSVYDDSIVSTAIHFEKTEFKVTELNIDKVSDSLEAGKKLASDLIRKGLLHVFVISDGQKVNGSKLVQGLNEKLPNNVTVTGGLAGDCANFEKTFVGYNEQPSEGNIVAIGFYGNNLKIGYGSVGGWDSFGPERLITKAEDNILYELDGQSALELYKKYLGERASGLPATGLLFPLSIKQNENEKPVVRTILAVDESKKSMTFAGDMPVGAYARLMKANFDRIIDGASLAANDSFEAIGSITPDLAILISCVGRKIVLDQRIEEEVENVRDILGKNAILTGFYSYGEISPFVSATKCQLHNQTMTITTFSEI